MIHTHITKGFITSASLAAIMMAETAAGIAPDQKSQPELLPDPAGSACCDNALLVPFPALIRPDVERDRELIKEIQSLREQVQEFIDHVSAQERKDAWTTYAEWVTFGALFFAVCLATWQEMKARKQNVQTEKQLARLDELVEQQEAQIKLLGDLATQQEEQANKQFQRLNKLAEQQKDQTKAEKEAFEKLGTHVEKMGGFRKDADRFAIEIGRLMHETRTLARSNMHNAHAQKAILYADGTVLSIKKKQNRQKKVGEHPAMFAYLTERVKSTRKQAILKMPISLFGILGNPRGQSEFYQTLREVFDQAAGGPKLVVLLYDEERRINLAAHRYSRAVDALKILHDRGVCIELLQVLDDDISDVLKPKIMDFNRDLNNKIRRRIYELAAQQYYKEKKDQKYQETIRQREEGAQEMLEEIKDDVFAASLKDSDRELFDRIRAVRKALSEALVKQEMRNFQPDGEPDILDWPGVTIIPVAGTLDDKKFSNEMILCIDGKEIIYVTSDMTDLQSRSNEVISKVGPKALREYKNDLSDILKLAGIKKGSAQYKEIMKPALKI